MLSQHWYDGAGGLTCNIHVLASFPKRWGGFGKYNLPLPWVLLFQRLENF